MEGREVGRKGKLWFLFYIHISIKIQVKQLLPYSLDLTLDSFFLFFSFFFFFTFSKPVSKDREVVTTENVKTVPDTLKAIQRKESLKHLIYFLYVEHPQDVCFKGYRTHVEAHDPVTLEKKKKVNVVKTSS